MLWSATVPAWVQKVSRRYLRDPKLIDLVESSPTLPSNLANVAVAAHGGAITDVTCRVIAAYSGNSNGKASRCLAFCNTKVEVQRMAAAAAKMPGVRTAGLSGDLSQQQRESVLADFRAGESRGSEPGVWVVSRAVESGSCRCAAVLLCAAHRGSCVLLVPSLTIATAVAPPAPPPRPASPRLASPHRLASPRHIASTQAASPACSPPTWLRVGWTSPTWRRWCTCAPRRSSAPSHTAPAVLLAPAPRAPTWSCSTRATRRTASACHHSRRRWSASSRWSRCRPCTMRRRWRRMRSASSGPSPWPLPQRSARHRWMRCSGESCPTLCPPLPCTRCTLPTPRHTRAPPPPHHSLPLTPPPPPTPPFLSACQVLDQGRARARGAGADAGEGTAAHTRRGHILAAERRVGLRDRDA